MNKAVEELVAENQHLIGKISKEFEKDIMTAEELADAGKAGLQKAAEKYPQDADFEFSELAEASIRLSIEIRLERMKETFIGTLKEIAMKLNKDNPDYKGLTFDYDDSLDALSDEELLDNMNKGIKL